MYQNYRRVRDNTTQKSLGFRRKNEDYAVMFTLKWHFCLLLTEKFKFFVEYYLKSNDIYNKIFLWLATIIVASHIDVLMT